MGGLKFLDTIFWGPNNNGGSTRNKVAPATGGLPHSYVADWLKHKTTHCLLQVWNTELADIAQAYAELCVFDHNDERSAQSVTFEKVGENLAATNGPADYSALVQEWYNEVNDYIFSTGECSGPTCGHYTQVRLRYT